jgi:hypothetical protein
MTAALFTVFLALMAAVVVALTARYVNCPTAFRVLAGLSVWFAYVGLMGYSGVARNASMRPPGVAFIVVPVWDLSSSSLSKCARPRWPWPFRSGLPCARKAFASASSCSCVNSGSTASSPKC